MHPLIQLKRATSLFLIVLGFAWLGLLSKAQAVSPAPDGGYPGGNTAEGQDALLSLFQGGYNTAVGFLSLRSNATGSFNTALGAGTLLLNTVSQNTATGAGALFRNTTGTPNTANGAFALFSNTTGGDNTATGATALQSNTTGFHNTANGYQALFSNTNGSENTADGVNALYSNTTGGSNTANGFDALFNNTTSVANTAIGYRALFNSTNGGNTAVGATALENNTTGYDNTAVGGALSNNTTGALNVGLGNSAGFNVVTASQVICIGSILGADVSNTTWIANVYNVATQNGTTAPVIVSADGQLGTVASSERFKKDIATMDKASEVIMSLRPVSFHYKSDTKGTPQFGLIAEEVAKVNPALVIPDKEGKPYTVRYDAVNAMLLNEFLKEHREVQELKKQVAALTAGLQKVSAQLELSKSAPQTVLNNR